MTEPSTRELRNYIVGDYTNWVTDFSIDDFLAHPPLIAKLREEKQAALLRISELEEELNAVEQELAPLKVKNATLQAHADDTVTKSSAGFGLSLLALLLIALGIGLVTANGSDWKGWLMIVSGCVAEIIAFFLQPRRERLPK